MQINSLKPYLFIFIFLFFSLYYFNNLNIHPLHADEHEFIKKAYYYDLFFIKKDFNNTKWHYNDSPDQPKVGPYIFGMTLHLSGIKNIENKLKDTMFNKVSPDKTKWWVYWLNKKLENLPSEFLPGFNLIFLGRITSVLFSISSILLIFVLFIKTKQVLFGFLASFIIGTHPLIFLFTRRAMTDSMQLFFFITNLILVYLYINKFRKSNLKNTLFLSLLLGLNCALGVGVKVSGIMIYFFNSALLLSLIFINLKSKIKTSKTIILSFILFTFSFFVSFVFLHPYTHKNTIPQFISMFTDRLEYADKYRLSHKTTAIYSRQNAAKSIIQNTLLPHGSYTNLNLFWFPIDLILFTIGLILMAKRALNSLSTSQEITIEFLLLLWFVIVTGCLIYYLRNNWPRYYIPIVVSITLFETYALAKIAKSGYNKIKKYLS